MSKQRSIKLISLISIFLFFSALTLGQNRYIFTYRDKDSSSFSLDFSKEIHQKDSSKTNIFGFIFDRTLDVQKDKQVLENWVSPYDVSKLNIEKLYNQF
jgi:hypothetical protein